MNKVVTLTRTLLKSIEIFSLGGKKKKKVTVLSRGLGAALFIAILAFSFGIPAFLMSSGLYDTFAKFNMQGIVLTGGYSAISMMCLFFGFFSVISVYYFSKDLDMLLPLPLKESEILTAKFLVTIIYQYILVAVIFIPMTVAYGMKSGAGVMFYVYGVLNMLLLPVIPLVVVSLLGMVIMSFTNLFRNKDAFRMITGILVIGLCIGYNFYVSQSASNPEKMEQLISSVSSGTNGLFNVTRSMFPSAVLAAKVQLSSGSIQGVEILLLLLAGCAASYAVFMMVGQKIYLKGAVGNSEAYSKKTKLSSEKYSSATRRNSQFRAFYMKELRLAMRTPAYFLNCVLPNFLLVIILFVPVMGQSSTGLDLGKIMRGAMADGSGSLILMAVVAFMMFAASTSALTSTSISREGQSMYASKYLPVNFKQMFMAKVLFGTTLNTIGMIMLLIGMAFLKTPMIIMIVSFILGMLAILFASFTGLIIDLKKPKLVWDDEQKAVKQNMNSLKNVGVCVAVAGLLWFAAYKLKLSFTVSLVLLALFLVVSNALLYVYLVKNGDKLLEKI